MIDHSRKAIYLHIGKTAGSAIEHLLFGQLPDPYQANHQLMFGMDRKEGIYLQHATAATMRRLAGVEVFDSYYKFTIVRDPYTRLLSVYHYLLDLHQQEFGDFAAFVRGLHKILEQPHVQKGSHYLPQSAYTHIDGQLICDHVGKFENLPVSIDCVRERLGIKSPMKKVNAQRSKDWSVKSPAEYYDAEMVTIMQDLYADDFRLFDYPAVPSAT